MNEEKQICEIEEKVYSRIQKYAMLSHCDTVLVGLSGGADSMALAYFLHFIGKYHVVAAHVNHGIRGQEAQRDEQFVTEWCQQQGIRLFTLHADVPHLAAGEKIGIEECGRKVRYDFFRKTAEKEHAKIATAHTLSDQTETILFHLARGTGMRGLCGIAPVWGNIIRPFLSLSREEVERFCAFYQIPYVTDSSNLQTEYARNQIRHTVVPGLKKINPALDQAILRLSELAQQDEECLWKQAETVLQKAKDPYGYEIEELNQWPDAIVSRCVQIAAEKVSTVLQDAAHIEKTVQIIRLGKGAVAGNGKIQFRVERNRFLVCGPAANPCWKLPLSLPKMHLPDGRWLEITVFSKKEAENQMKINNLLFNNLLDYDTILNNTFLRTREAGDRFSPAGRGISKDLKRLFQEADIPASKRGQVLLLEQHGIILWAEGFGAAQQACVTEKTQRCALIEIKEC